MEGSRLSGTWVAPCQSGPYVVFMAKDPKSSIGDTSLWRVNTTYNEIMKLTDGPFDGFPVCSPDGKWIYYLKVTSQSMLQRVSINGGTSQAVMERMEVFPAIDVSHDGKLLSYWSSDAWHGHVGVINIESGKVEREFQRELPLRESSLFDTLATYPRFTPNDKALVYAIRVNGVDNLWVQPINGAKGYPLSSFKSDEIYDFHWSPSGHRLGIVRGRTESNVVLIREANH